MISEYYKYHANEAKTFYLFLSKSENTTILKAIIFSPIKGRRNFWNLAFGDLKNGNINDSVISNNQDIVKVINTVAKAVYDFSNQYPERVILIKPVDEKRKRLYNHVFRRHFENIKLDFHVAGSLNGIEEDYNPKKFYDFFKLKPIFVI